MEKMLWRDREKGVDGRGGGKRDWERDGSVLFTGH